MSATYVYCLIASGRIPAVDRIPAGLPGTGPVRLLDVSGDDPMGSTGTARLRSRSRAAGPAQKQWLAVADAPLPQYGEASINRRLSDLDWVSRAAIAHEAVVESFIDAHAVLPMKLFTIFNNDVRALEHLRRDRSRIGRLLKRVAGHHEWGVRVVLDPAHRPPSKRHAVGAPAAPGVAYLALKKAQRDRSSELVQRARTTVADLYDRLRARASASRRRAATEWPAQGGPLLLDAAFLVPRSRSAQFRALVGRQSKALASHGYQLVLSGPWPPYTFISD
jgi:Gas vesicle synthesis protein GvpL/GvpF